MAPSLNTNKLSSLRDALLWWTCPKMFRANMLAEESLGSWAGVRAFQTSDHICLFLWLCVSLFRDGREDKSKNAEFRKTLPQMERSSEKLELSFLKTQIWPRLCICHSLCVLFCRNWIEISQNKTLLKPLDHFTGPRMAWDSTKWDHMKQVWSLI